MSKGAAAVRRSLVLEALLASSLLLAGSVAPRAAQDAATGTITGRVVDAASNAPIAGAEVNVTRVLVGPPTPDDIARQSDALARGIRPPRTLTASDGSFVLSDVPSGTLILHARMAGYVGGYFGQARAASTREGQRFELGPAQHASGIVLRLWRAGTIAGRVRTEQGDPIAGRFVQALRISTGGKAPLQLMPPASAVRSDASGEYRIGELQPGRYLVQVSESEPPSMLDDLYALLTPRGGLPSMVDLTNGVVFYRSAALPTDAQIVAVGASEDVAGIDVTVPHSPVATSVSGRIVGVPPGFAGARVRLLTSGPASVLGDGFEITATDADDDGAFTFAHVPAGTYVVRGITWAGDSPGGGPTAPVPDASGLFAGPSLLWFSQTVVVKDAPVRGLELPALPGSRISGRIVAGDGQTPLGPGELRDLQILVDALDGWNLQGLTGVPINSDGTFRTMSLPPGHFLLSTYSRTPPDQTLHAASIFVGNLNVRDAGFSVSGTDISGVKVVMTRRATRITGVVVDAKGARRPDADLLYFPADPQAWNLRTIRQARPGASGEFTLDVLPGEYAIAAVDDGIPDNWLDPAFLSALLPKAVKVRADPGTMAAPQVTIQPTPR